MGDLNADLVNPFIISATKMLKDLCMIDAKVGKPFIRDNCIEHDSAVILLGLTGQLRGQVMIILSKSAACDIASKMIMMPVEQIDELSGSAISELGNMILGNAATLLSNKGITIDITPPSLCTGDMTFMTMSKSISVPLAIGNGNKMELNIGIL